MEKDIKNMAFNIQKIASILSHQLSEKPIATEQIINIPGQLGKGKIRRMEIKAGLEIVISDMELIRDLTVYIEEDCKYFEMNGQQFKKLTNRFLMKNRLVILYV